ncbi:MAG: hypothetical protein HGA55_04515 [Methanoregulaceae archaeon]|nr:hypothetical protein [Methanoregulaceae archaeon]
MMDTIAEGGQCLVFVSSRRNAEAFAKRAAKALNLRSPELSLYERQLDKLAATDQEKALAHCVGLGSAFHHAGLRREARSIVEDGFRNGNIRCISSTPTLAAGLNLPARRVIIKEYRRYVSGEGMVPIPAREYHQMAGRAGRPGLDPYGEAVLISDSEREAGSLFSNYIDAIPEDVNSQCASENALTSHILSLIASGFVSSGQDLLSFMRDTFFFHQKKADRFLEKITGNALSFLDQKEMIVASGDFLSSTEYGNLVSQLYIDPLGADLIVENLIGSDFYSDLGLLQVICSTPDMFTLFVNRKDVHFLERFLLEHEDELWLDLPFSEDEAYFRGLKTAMVLNDWTNELSDATICEKYGIGPGDIYALNDTIHWLIHASARLARMFRQSYVNPLQDFELCLKHGVKRELIPLVRIRNIGRVRARRLYNNGFTSPEMILSAGEDRIIPILGHGITTQIFQELHEPSKGNKTPPENTQPRSGLFRFVNEGDNADE